VDIGKKINVHAFDPNGKVLEGAGKTGKIAGGKKNDTLIKGVQGELTFQNAVLSGNVICTANLPHLDKVLTHHPDEA